MFQIVLNQIESYDNLVEVVVDAAKSITICAYDVLTFSLLTSLSNENKKRLKEDGTSIAQWLQGLASFCGRLFRRYSTMDPLPIVEYVINQIKANNPYDLLILRELVGQMAGLQAQTNLSESQLQGLAGGEILSTQAMSLINEKRSVIRKSSSRLINCLRSEDLTTPLLILLAQLRSSCIYKTKEAETHLKLLGNLYDSCQDTLLLYTTLLTTNMDPVAYAAVVPPFQDLLESFGIEPVVAFHISRPVFKHLQKILETETKSLDKAAPKADKDTKAAEESKTNETENDQSKGTTNIKDENEDVVMKEISNEVENEEMEEGEHRPEEDSDDVAMADGVKPEVINGSLNGVDNEAPSETPFNKVASSLLASTPFLVPSEASNVIRYILGMYGKLTCKPSILCYFLVAHIV